MRICDNTRFLATLVFITSLICSIGCFSFGFYGNNNLGTSCDYAKTPWYCRVQDVFHALFGQEEDWTAPCYRCSGDNEQRTDETFNYVPLFNTSYYNTTALELVGGIFTATLWTTLPDEQQTASFYNQSLVFVQDVYTATWESSNLVRNSTIITTLIEYITWSLILIRENFSTSLGSFIHYITWICISVSENISCFVNQFIDYLSSICTSVSDNVSRFAHPIIDYLSSICSSAIHNVSCFVCPVIEYLTWNYSSRSCVCLWSGVTVMVLLTAALHLLRGARRRHGSRSAQETQCSEYEIVSLDKKAQVNNTTDLAYDLCFTCFEPFTESVPCRCSNTGDTNPQRSNSEPRSLGRRSKSGSLVKDKHSKSSLDESASPRSSRFPFDSLNNNILKELPLHVHNQMDESIPWDEYVCYSLENFFEIPRWVTAILLCIRQDCTHDHSQVKVHGQNVVVNKDYHEKQGEKGQHEQPPHAHDKIIEDVGHVFTKASKYFQTTDIAFLKGCGDIRNTGYLGKNEMHADTGAQTIVNDEVGSSIDPSINTQPDVDNDNVQSLSDDEFTYYIDVPIVYQRNCPSNQKNGDVFLETIPETDETSSISPGCEQSIRPLTVAGTMFRNIADVFFQSASVKGQSPRGHGMWIDVSIDGDEEKDAVFTETHDHWHSVGDAEHNIENSVFDDDDDGFTYASVGLPLAESSFDNLSLPSYLLDSSLENSCGDTSLDLLSEVTCTPDKSTVGQSSLKLDLLQLSKNSSILNPDTSMYQVPALLLADCIIRRLSRVDQIREEDTRKPNLTI